MQLVFFGTSDYCLPVLEALHQNFDLVLVVTRPDKPVGRKKILTPSATKLWAQKKHVPVVTPSTLKKDTSDRLSFLSTLSNLSPDLAVVSDFGLIIPQGIFNLPSLGTINIHFSKLPDLRGPSPVQSTLLRGDTKAWISIFKLENPPELEIKMDSGPILWQKDYSILSDDTTSTLYTRLFQEAAKELPKVICDYSLNPAHLFPQDHTKATFCQFLTRDDGFVKYADLEKSETYNKFRAYYPWPGIWSIKDGNPTSPSGLRGARRMKILKCHLEKNKLILDQIQFEGEKSQSPSRDVVL